jgi:hypothetical protein
MSRKEKERRMFKIITGWQQSNMSQSAYAEKSGLSVSCFQYWLGKYRSNQNQALNDSFVEVLAGPSSLAVEADFDIIYPNGVRVSMGSGFDSVLLDKLIKLW